MKHSLVLGTVLAISAVANGASAYYCARVGGFPPQCESWAPTPPPGWAPTGGDNNAYPNEIVICSEFHMKGHCFYRSVQPGTEVGSASLMDMDAAPAYPGWKIQSIKTNLARGATIYDGANYTGATHELSAGQYYIWGLNIFQTSSLKARN